MHTCIGAVLAGYVAVIPVVLDSDSEALRKAQQLLNRSDYEGAIKDLTRVIQNEPNNSEAYRLRAEAYFSQRQTNKALADCNNAIRVNPRDAAAYSLRGRVYQLINESSATQKALDDFAESIRLRPKDPAAHMYRGILNYIEADYAKAISDLSTAFQLAPRDQRATYARALGWCGLARYELGDFSRAREDFKNMTVADPNDPIGYLHLAQVLSTCPDAKLRDGRQAIECASKACTLSKFEDQEALEALAASYAETGDFGNAIKWQEKSIEVGRTKVARFHPNASGRRLASFQHAKPLRYKTITEWRHFE
jgi:tetratricopeptide (TPR) repeat protein